MRKCLRCGTEMKENCAIKVEGAGYGIVMSSDENKLFGGRIGKPKVAICPKCGEVSIYVEDVEKLWYVKGTAMKIEIEKDFPQYFKPAYHYKQNRYPLSAEADTYSVYPAKWFIVS